MLTVPPAADIAWVVVGGGRGGVDGEMMSKRVPWVVADRRSECSSLLV